jgi:hypothetical protein
MHWNVVHSAFLELLVIAVWATVSIFGSTSSVWFSCVACCLTFVVPLHYGMILETCWTLKTSQNSSCNTVTFSKFTHHRTQFNYFCACVTVFASPWITKCTYMVSHNTQFFMIRHSTGKWHYDLMVSLHGIFILSVPNCIICIKLKDHPPFLHVLKFTYIISKQTQFWNLRAA